MIPLVKKRWKKGYTHMMGRTTITVTVMRMDVAVAACAREAIIALDDVELLTSAFKLLA